MKLSLKAAGFVIEAIDFYQKHMNEKKNSANLSEDDISDLENDYYYYEAIKSDLKKYHDGEIEKLSKS